MHESTTITTQPLSRPVAPRSPSPLATRVHLAPVQKVTRAHLAAAARPTLRGALEEATRRVVGRLGEVLACDVGCEARLLNATLHPFSHLAARALFVTVELGGETLGVLELDLLGVGALLKQVTGSTDLAAAPLVLTRIEEAALGWLALATLSAMRQEPVFAAVAPRLVSLTLDRGEVLQQLDGRRRHVAVNLDLAIGATRASGRLLLAAQWLQARVEAMPGEPLPSPCPEVLAATLPARCVFGWTMLGRAEARALGRGDVVLFPGVTQGPQGLHGPARLLAPSFELCGSFTAAGFTLTRAFERPSQEPHMTSSDPTVPVEVEVELTRLRLPLDQLGTVRPGQVLPLHVNAASHVVLRIGDKAVARAELVEVEGEIGARITTML
jgi:type III secretion protein Q